MTSLYRLGWFALSLASVSGAFSLPVQAQVGAATYYPAGAALTAWNDAFVRQTNGTAYFVNGLASLSSAELGGYGEALDIAAEIDAYERTHSPALLTLINQMIPTFESYTGASWAGDVWDDDIGWMVNVYTRAYAFTQNPAYLAVAENNWNAGYNQGWSSDLGGGIWEKRDDPSAGKQCLSNNPYVWEGVALYRYTGDASYLTKAEALYAWVRANLFNSTNSTTAIGAPGALVQGINANGLLSGDNLYNSGSFVMAADALYEVTGNIQYYNDAVLAIGHVVNNTSVPIVNNNQNGSGNQWAYWFMKAVSQFATHNGLWGTYYPWMLANANAAWNERDSLNLTWNDWTNPTQLASSAEQSVPTSSAMAVWQQLDIPAQVQIINQHSGLAMDLISGNLASNAVIEQWPQNGSTDPNQQWMLTATPDGHYSIISSLTGMAATISAASTTEGAQLVDWPYAINNTSLEFDLIAQGNGWYLIRNVNSGLVLDDEAWGTTNGTPIIQWPASGQSNQLWSFQPVGNFAGTYEIRNVASGLALNVRGASLAQAAAIIQYPFDASQTNSLWQFVPTSNGYYRIQSVSSGQYLNVTADSAVNGASIVQWPAASQGNDQWLPVLNPDGSYTFFNLSSELVLDNPGGNTVGAQMDQWNTNGGTNQEFTLIRQ